MTTTRKNNILAILISILMALAMIPMTAGAVFADADTEPPEVDLNSITLTTTSGNSTVTAGQSATFSCEITDNREVSGAHLTYQLSGSDRCLGGSMSYDNDTNTWYCVMDIDENTYPGTYKLHHIEAYDTSSNYGYLYNSDLTDEYTPRENLSAYDFTVTGTTPDTEPPVIDPLNISRTTSSGNATVTADQSVTFSCKITDNRKVSGAHLTYQLSGSDRCLGGSMRYDNDTNTWYCVMDIDENTYPGTYQIHHIEAYDTSSNYGYLYNSDLTDEYTPRENLSAYDFTVTGTTPDTEPPVIDPLNISRTTTSGNSTVTADQSVTFSCKITDNRKVSGAPLTYQLSGSDRCLGGSMRYDNDTNTWYCVMDIDENTYPGTYKLHHIEAYDTSNNYGYLYNSDLTDEYTPRENLSAYDFTVAQTCLVQFDTRGGSKVASQNVIPGENAVQPDDPTRDGGSFAGWYADKALTQKFNFNIPITADTKVYAKWYYRFSISNYDITNHTDETGGKYAVLREGETEADWARYYMNMILLEGDKLTLKAKNEIGYKFLGWYKGVYTGTSSQAAEPLDTSDPKNLISSDTTYEYTCSGYEVICPVFEVCTAHEWEEKVQKATPTANGRIYQVCKLCGTEETVAPLLKVSKISLAGTSYTYTGKAITPKVTVANASETLSSDCYTVTYSGNTNVGTATAKVTLKGDYYEGSKSLTFKINKAANPLTVKAKTATVKLSKLKKKNQTLAVSKLITFTKNGQGKTTYTLSSAKKGKKSFKKYFTVNKKNGKVTVKKKLAKGTYKLKINVTAAGNGNYNKATKPVTVTIKIK